MTRRTFFKILACVPGLGAAVKVFAGKGRTPRFSSLSREELAAAEAIVRDRERLSGNLDAIRGNMLNVSPCQTCGRLVQAEHGVYENAVVYRHCGFTWTDSFASLSDLQGEASQDELARWLKRRNVQPKIIAKDAKQTKMAATLESAIDHVIASA